MSKRRNEEGSWDTVKRKGHIYKRYRIDGKDFTGKTERECREKYDTWKHGQHTNLKDKKTTVNHVAADWVNHKKKHVKASTYDGYEYFVNDILGTGRGYDLGNKQIIHVTARHVQNYIDCMADFLPKSSIKKNKSLLRQIFKYAKKEGIITIDPAEDIILPSDNNISIQTKEYTFLSIEDRKKLELEETKVFSNGVRVYGNNAKMAIFLLHTGLRFGELTALKWKNVDLKEKTIFIIENSPIIKNRDSSVSKQYILDQTSTKRKASERYIPLSQKAMEIIMYFYASYPHEPDNLVFVSSEGTPANRRNVNRTILSMLKSAKCEVTDASAHDLRHSFGSELIKKGVDIKVVSTLLGHADITTTYNIYIHILDKQRIAAIEVFDQ